MAVKCGPISLFETFNWNLLAIFFFLRFCYVKKNPCKQWLLSILRWPSLFWIFLFKQALSLNNITCEWSFCCRGYSRLTLNHDFSFVIDVDGLQGSDVRSDVVIGQMVSQSQGIFKKQLGIWGMPFFSVRKILLLLFFNFCFRLPNSYPC